MKPFFDSSAFLSAMRQGGNAAELAARQLLQHYRPILRAQLFAARVSAEHVEDLLAELLFKIITQARQVRAAEALHSWIMTLGRHEIAAHWRRLGRERELFSSMPSPPDDDPDAALDLLQQLPDASVSDPVLRRCLQGQLTRFERSHADYHACVTLLALGHEAPEIAELQGRSHGGARQHISECCAILMSYLRPCMEGLALKLRRGGARSKA